MFDIDGGPKLNVVPLDAVIPDLAHVKFNRNSSGVELCGEHT